MPTLGGCKAGTRLQGSGGSAFWEMGILGSPGGGGQAEDPRGGLCYLQGVPAGISLTLTPELGFLLRGFSSFVLWLLFNFTSPWSVFLFLADVSCCRISLLPPPCPSSRICQGPLDCARPCPSDWMERRKGASFPAASPQKQEASSGEMSHGTSWLFLHLVSGWAPPPSPLPPKWESGWRPGPAGACILRQPELVRHLSPSVQDLLLLPAVWKAPTGSLFQAASSPVQAPWCLEAD